MILKPMIALLLLFFVALGAGVLSGVVGTGSSRKSATNSVLWWTGEDIPFVPNKRFGGVCLGGKIAPIFTSKADTRVSL